MDWKKLLPKIIAVSTFLLIMMHAASPLLASEAAAQGDTGSSAEQEPPSIAIKLDGMVIPSDVEPVIESGRVLVPMRFLFQALGGKVTWHEKERAVEVNWKNNHLVLTVDTARALVNNKPVTLDVPARILKGRTMVPLRFAAESLGLGVHWDAEEYAVYLQTGLLQYQLLEIEFTALQADDMPVDEEDNNSEEGESEAVRSEDESSEDESMEEVEAASNHEPAGEAESAAEVELPSELESSTSESDEPAEAGEEQEEKSYTVQVHTIRLGSGFKPKVGLAQGLVGCTAHLANIARDYKATAAITGTYFNYLGSHPDPYGTIFSRGRVVHLGSEGTTAAFHKNGSLSFYQLVPSVRGTINGSSDPGWSAFGINHTSNPDKATTYVYTPDRGERIGFSHGTSVVVEKGRVVGIYEDENVAIPRDGFVINFTDWHKGLAKSFQIGDEVDYTISFTDAKTGLPVSLDTVEEAISCWPMLITNGEISTWSGGERAARTALAQRGGTIYLAATPAATPLEFATILQEYLGAENALNLDGGGSAGLYLYGHYIMQPARRISNALVFIQP